MSLKRSRYTIASDQPFDGKRLLLHGITGALDEVSDSVAAFLQEHSITVEDAIAKYQLDLDTIELLKRRGYLTELPEDQERKYIGKFVNKLHAIKLKNCASFMMVVTYLCNLRCHYCFQKPLVEEGRKRIKTDIIREDMVLAAFAAMDRLIKQQDARHSFELFGGEPLLGRSRGIVEFIINEARARRFIISATSNATDLHHYKDLLGPGGIESIQITLDGDPATHDQIRIYQGGKGSFQIISDNISMALELGVQINLRINIAKYNLDRLPAIVDHIKKQGWAGRKNFCVGLAEVHYIGIQPDRSNQLERFELVDRISRLNAPQSTRKALLRGIFGRHFNYSPGKSPAPKFDTCFCNAMQGHYIFDPYGNVYTCTEDVGFERARVGSYYPNELQFDPVRLDRWHQRTVANLPDCPNCEFLQVCGGGCARNALLDTGDAWTSYCTDFKHYFPRLLTLLHEDIRTSDGSEAEVLGMGQMVTACKS
jgi:uncharacterized protein